MTWTARCWPESPTEPWKGEPFLARTPEQVIECAGSFYNQTLALAALDLTGHDLPPQPRIAVVGTPCEVEAIRAMQARPGPGAPPRSTRSPDHRPALHQELQLREADGHRGPARRGIPLEQVGKVDVIHGRMIVEGTDGQVLVDEPVRDFHREPR